METVTEYFSANEFGLKRVVFDAQRNLRTLFHENSRHGIQSADPERAFEPLAYYSRSGPLGDVFSAFAAGGAGEQVAIIGLGAGSVAAYAAAGQHFTFFEIDPAMAQIAGDPRYFTFLSQCSGTCEVVLGDGLAMLAQVPDRQYHLIVQDAFTSDVIPEHLVSREALEVYFAKLAEGGLLAFHTSNVHVDLAPRLAKMAGEVGLVCLARADFSVGEKECANGKLPSQYVVMARAARDIGALADDPLWKEPGGDRAPQP